MKACSQIHAPASLLTAKNPDVEQYGPQKRSGRFGEEKNLSPSVAYREGGSSPPPPEIPKALHNRAKLNPIVKTVENCWI